MKNVVITLSTIVALSVNIQAGGKYVEPEDAPVKEIPVLINPFTFYVGLGVVAAGLSRDCTCGNTTERVKDMTYGGIVRLGWDYNKYIGIEGRYINASIEDDFSKTTHYGLYLKPQYPVTQSINIYGLLGYGKTTVDYDNNKDKTSTLSETGFSYGAGIEYALSKQWALWSDYQHLLDDASVFSTDSNIFSLGVRYTF